ncbi:hypothetical protein [uncultured Pontibacter sp.]|uniref:hypothetical protein n=1 Tax=uncultured Pontibacter sp. TaxID=453356 RepID=UPI00261A7117|nr:hypothetical protein [uncultured Pontibacter sp.]
MKDENLAIPLILTAFLLVSSFVPVAQILLIYLNSALVYPITRIAGTDSMAVHYVTDGLLATITLLGFYNSKKTIWKILSAFGFTLFMLPMLLYATEGIFNEEDQYYLRFMFFGTIVGIPLVLVGILKMKKERLHITRHRL